MIESTKRLLESFQKYEAGHTMLLDYTDLDLEDFAAIWSPMYRHRRGKRVKCGIYIYIMHEDDDNHYHGVRYVIWYQLKDDHADPDPLKNPVEHYVLFIDQFFDVKKLSSLRAPHSLEKFGIFKGVYHDQDSAIAHAYDCFDPAWHTVFHRHWIPYKVSDNSAEFLN